MKNVLLAVLLYCGINASAQLHIEKSALLDHIPRGGYNKVVLLHDGKTAYVRFNGDGAMHLSIFGTDHRSIQKYDIVGRGWDASSYKNVTIEGTYEMNGELVLFIRQVAEKQASMYRLRVNEQDGKVLSEDEIAVKREEARPLKVAAPPIIFGGKPQVGPGAGMGRAMIRVVKDVYSDCYAVVFLDNLTEGEDAVKVMHYDGSHHLLDEGHIKGPGEPAQDIAYNDAVVIGNKAVVVTTYYEGSKKEPGKMLINRINAGDSIFSTKPLAYTEGFGETFGQLYYNKNSGLLELLTSSEAGKKLLKAESEHEAFLAYIDPVTLEVRSAEQLNADKINNFAKSVFSIDDDFSGLAEGIMINDRGETVVYRQDVRNKPFQGGQGSTHIMILGDIAISKFGADNKEKDAYYLPFKRLEPGYIPALYMRQSDRGLFYANPDDYSFKYFCGKESEYVIVNNYVRSIEGEWGIRMNELTTPRKDMNTELFIINNGKVTKDYLFDKPKDSKFNGNTCLLNGGDYSGGLYATVMVTQVDKDSATAQIVWIEIK